MSSDHDAQLLKGVLSLLLLHLLSERESYGYQLVQRLHEVGLTGILEGTVYLLSPGSSVKGASAPASLPRTPGLRASTTDRPGREATRSPQGPPTGCLSPLSSARSSHALSPPSLRKDSDMPHTVTWIDRLRIERVVWTLDQRLYDLPRRTRIETRREVRQNLLTGARDVGTTQALQNLGGSAELRTGIPLGRVRIEASPLVDGSRPLLRDRSVPRHFGLRRCSECVRQRDRRRRSGCHRDVHLGRGLAFAEHGHVHVRRR